MTRRGNECGRSEGLHLRSTCRRGLTFVGPLVADTRRSPNKGRTLGSATVRPLQLPSLSRFAFAVLRTPGRIVEEEKKRKAALKSSSRAIAEEKRGRGGLHTHATYSHSHVYPIPIRYLSPAFLTEPTFACGHSSGSRFTAPLAH